MAQNFSHSQQQILVLTTKPTLFISFICAAATIYRVGKNPLRRNKVYHRLIFVMMVVIGILCVNLAIGSLAMPADTGFYLSHGSSTTCTIQGVLSTFCSSAIFIYYSMLGLFSYLAISCDFNEAKIRSLEPWFHGLGLCVPFLVSLLGVPGKIYRPSGPWCFISRKKEKCNIKTCPRSGLFILFYMTLFIFNTGCICALYRLANKKAMQNTRLQGKKIIVEKIRLKSTQLIRRQALLYLASFYIGMGVPFITRVYEWGIQSIPFSCTFVRTFCTSFQGAIIVFAYECTRSRNRDKIIKKNISQEGTSVQATRRRSRKKTPLSDTELTTKVPDGRTYSIFDGSPDSSSPWAEFIDAAEDSVHIDIEEDYFYNEESENVGEKE